MSETLNIIKTRVGALNEVAKMLEEELITFPEYLKNVYHGVFYWYHGDMIAIHQEKKAKHDKWLTEQAEIYQFRQELRDQ